MKFTATSSGEVGRNEFRIRKPECSILQQSIYLKAFSVHMATYTHPGLWGEWGCVWLCAWSWAATSVAWHSFILFPYKRISKLPTVWEWIPTEQRTGHSNGIIILSFEWSLGKHYTLILCLKLGTDWGCAEWVSLSLCSDNTVIIIII